MTSGQANVGAEADTTDYRDVLIDHEWATRYRIPVSTSPYLSRSYEVALVVPDGEPRSQFATMHVVWPTEQEAAIIGSAIDYRRSYYFEHWQNKMLRRRLDFDSMTNPYVYVKHEDGWRYRRPTWQGQMWNHTPKPPTVAGLIELLDDTLNGHGWFAWKEAHPEVFAGSSPG